MSWRYSSIEELKLDDPNERSGRSLLAGIIILGRKKIKPSRRTSARVMTDSEETELIVTDSERRVSGSKARCLRIATLVTAGLTVVILGALAIVTVILGLQEGSSSAISFALEAFLDCVSSLIVIWRYSAPASVYSSDREKKACIALGVLFFVLAGFIIVKSLLALINGDSPHQNFTILVVSYVNASLCFIFTVVKGYLAWKLESVSIATDAVNSGIGFLLALSIIITGVLLVEVPYLWYFEPIVGVVCSVLLIMYGMWVIIFEIRLGKN